MGEPYYVEGKHHNTGNGPHHYTTAVEIEMEDGQVGSHPKEVNEIKVIEIGVKYD
jgi:hypothetical protein